MSQQFAARHAPQKAALLPNAEGRGKGMQKSKAGKELAKSGGKIPAFALYRSSAKTEI